MNLYLIDYITKSLCSIFLLKKLIILIQGFLKTSPRTSAGMMNNSNIPIFFRYASILTPATVSLIALIPYLNGKNGAIAL